MEIVRIIRKFGIILSRHQRLRIFELAILMIIGGLMETCSVSLILPFMDAVMSPGDTMNKWYAKIICDFFNLHSSGAFLMIMAIFLAALYIFKNLYLMFEYNIQYKFVYGNMFELKKKLLRAFLGESYEYFLKVNSGEVIRIINTDTTVAFNLLVTLLNLFTELVVSGMLIVTIFIIAPFVTTVIAFVLVLLLLFIYFFIKPILRRAGTNQQRSSSEMNKWLLQSIQGIKELKVMEKEDFFEQNFNRNGYIYVDALRKNQTLGIAPRFIIEGVSMGTMFVAISFLIYRGVDLESIIPIITAVAMAAIRLLPSVNRISYSLSQIAFSEPMLDKVIENLKIIHKDGDLETFSHETSDDIQNNFETSIELRNITYKYPDADDSVLLSSNILIRKGESIGIIGASGAGKTTLVDIILGLLKPQDGEVLVDNMEISADYRSWHNQIGYIPQMIFMLDDTIKANIAFGDSDVDENRIWDVIKEAALFDFVSSLSDGIETEIGERGVRLSGGQRQRIGIARALYRNPEVLVFDEATSALDNETESEIMESINQLHGKKTIIIIAHRLSTIELCDHIYRVENGKIIKER